jgi:hypothetical protein
MSSEVVPALKAPWIRIPESPFVASGGRVEVCSLTLMFAHAKLAPAETLQEKLLNVRSPLTIVGLGVIASADAAPARPTSPAIMAPPMYSFLMKSS